MILAVPVDFFTEAELEPRNQEGEEGMLGGSEIFGRSQNWSFSSRWATSMCGGCGWVSSRSYEALLRGGGWRGHEFRGKANSHPFRAGSEDFHLVEGCIPWRSSLRGYTRGHSRERGAGGAKGSSKGSKGKTKAQWGFAFRRAKAKAGNRSKSGSNYGYYGSHFDSFGSEAGGIGESDEASTGVNHSCSAFGCQLPVLFQRQTWQVETASKDISSASSSSCHYLAGHLGGRGRAVSRSLFGCGEGDAGTVGGNHIVGCPPCHFIKRSSFRSCSRVLQERPNCRPSWPTTMAASSTRWWS